MPSPLNSSVESGALKLMVYTDGRADSAKALRFAARLILKLNAELMVITSRSGTHADEQPPPLGQDIDLADRKLLTPGLRVLTAALDILSEEGLFQPQKSIQTRELHHGHVFFCNMPTGQRVPFYVCFGHMIEILNHEIDKHHFDLLIIAPPQRAGLRRMFLGDTSRKLVLNLHTSVLITRGGSSDSRFLVCADGSAAAKRHFPLLKKFLPAIVPPLELVCVLSSDSDQTALQEADECIRKAVQWLTACGKPCKARRLTGDRPAEIISAAAGDDAVIFLGASLRHDVYRRVLGSLAIQILARTNSSVLVVKALPIDDKEIFEDTDSC